MSSPTNRAISKAMRRALQHLRPPVDGDKARQASARAARQAFAQADESLTAAVGMLVQLELHDEAARLHQVLVDLDDVVLAIRA